MATLEEYFIKDFPHAIRISNPVTFNIENGETITFIGKIVADYTANSKFFSFYIESLTEPYVLFNFVLKNIETFHKLSNGDFGVHDIFGNVSVGDTWISLYNDLKFTGRVVFYYNGVIDRERFIALQNEFKKNGLIIQCFDIRLAIERNKKQKPFAFISHDWRDKSIAREIAQELEKRMCTVWFDEFTLVVGDSLRESIEKGLLECKKCILILSPHFLSNNGWTKTEFNTIFTREIIETKKLVLPVWHNVESINVFNYSPTLKDRVGVNTSIGLENLVRKLHRAIIADE